MVYWVKDGFYIYGIYEIGVLKNEYSENLKGRFW